MLAVSHDLDAFAPTKCPSHDPSADELAHVMCCSQGSEDRWHWRGRVERFILSSDPVAGLIWLLSEGICTDVSVPGGCGESMRGQPHHQGRQGSTDGTPRFSCFLELGAAGADSRAGLERNRAASPSRKNKPHAHKTRLHTAHRARRHASGDAVKQSNSQEIKQSNSQTVKQCDAMRCTPSPSPSPSP